MNPHNKLQDELELVGTPENESDQQRVGAELASAQIDDIFPDESEIAKMGADELPPYAEGVADSPSPAELSIDEQRSLLIALLFTSGEKLEAGRLREYFQLEAGDLDALAADAAGVLRPLGLDILPVAGGYKLTSASPLDEYIADFHREIRRTRLSRSALEVLAVVAYEQPVARATVDELRQVNSESALRALLDRRLIGVAGRAETPGRPFLYRTTDQFLEIFGLGSLDDLPPRPASFKPTSVEEDGDPGPFHEHEAIEAEAGADDPAREPWEGKFDGDSEL